MKHLDFLSPGQKLKYIRSQLGIKQIELEEIGVSRNYISMIESDKRNLNTSTLEKLVSFFENRVLELGIDFNIDKTKLALSKTDEARNYCNDRLSLKLNSKDIGEVISIGEEYSLVDILSKAYFEKGNLLYESNEFDKAIVYYYNTLETYSLLKDDLSKAHVYNKLGKCKLKTLCYDDALAYFFKCYFRIDENNNNNGELYESCIFNIALTYKKMGEFDNALLYINKLIKILYFQDNLNKYIDLMIVEANCYRGKKEFDIAIKLYNNIINLYEDQLGTSLGYIYNNLGLLYLEINKPNDSLIYFDKAINIRQNIDKATLSHSLIDKSKVYIKLNFNSEAILLLEEGISVAKEYQDKEFLLTGYMLIERIYENTQEYDKLENIYLRLISILENSDHDKIVNIYIKLSILYLNKKSLFKCKEYLLKAENISALN
jgi:tetratricopeptide (TPR) repeat protein